jgi:hypothetical protein
MWAIPTGALSPEENLYRQFVMTLHAEEEMSDDGLSIFDVERGILSFYREISANRFWQRSVTGRRNQFLDEDLVSNLRSPPHRERAQQ